MKGITNVALISLLVSIPGSKSLEGYNEPCELYDETSPCDHTKGLLCIDSGIKGYRCRCPTDNQFATIYDPVRRLCVGKVFNACVRSQNQSTENETLCVENAQCNTAVYYLPICLCKKGYFETDEGTCAPAKKYMEPCDNNKNQCDLKNGIICDKTEEKCKCKDSKTQFYDPQEEKCFTYANGSCSLDESLCVENAECVKSPKFSMMGSTPKRTIIFGSEEDTKKVGTFPGAPGTGPSRQVQDPYRDGADSPGKCLCKPGFSNSGGFCMKGYGSICNITADRNASCNPAQFLECMDSHDNHFRCQCRNALNERWDDMTNSCVAMMNRRCRPSSSYPRCEGGGICVSSTCQPKRGLKYNEKCQPGECDRSSGLTCIAKTGEYGSSCLCIDSYLTYDPQKSACVASIGSPCGEMDLISNGRGFDNRHANRGGEPGREVMPFIGCEAGATCSPQVSGKRMIHTCLRSRS